MVFAALVGGIVGARLWSVIENWDEAKDDLLGSLFSGSGLVFYGGLLGGAIAVLGWARWRGVLDLKMLDIGRGAAGGRLRDRADRLPARRRRRLRQGVGRAVGDGVSRTAPCRRPSRSTRRRSTRRSRWGSSPGSCGAGATACPPGGLFALYLVLAGTERFLVEFLRRNDRIFAGLTLPQLIALAMIAAGSIWLLRMRSARGVPAAARS